MKIIAYPDVFIKTRIVNGFTQRELATRAGISHAYLSMLERGEKSVGPGTAKRLCEVLNKRVDELFRIE